MCYELKITEIKLDFCPLPGTGYFVLRAKNNWDKNRFWSPFFDLFFGQRVGKWVFSFFFPFSSSSTVATAHNQCHNRVGLRHDAVHVQLDFVNGLLRAELWKSEEQFHIQVVLMRDGEAFTTVAITRVVFHQGGLLSGWSFIRVVFCQVI